MNCKLCISNLEAYLEGKLSGDMKRSMKTHLEGCADCRAYYASMLISDQMIHEEKQALSNPFMATRVMAAIDALEEAPVQAASRGVLQRILQPVLVTMSIALALFAGVAAGSLYNSGQQEVPLPVEFVYMDDAAMESLPVFMNE